MIRSSLSRMVRRRPPPIPYDMFDQLRSEGESARARHLERVYTRGQEKIWDGKQVLAELVAKHGKPDLPPDKAKAIRGLFAVILWGELAAWKVSADLALHLQPLEAKLAATSQAHDEARHFTVMHDYLDLLGYVPGELPPVASRTLHAVLDADSLVKKLMGMQLMVEPIALTLFQLAREQRIEPVLCDLLPYFERDEARHVALGVNHLPALLRGVGPREGADILIWQLGMFELEVRGMEELRPSFDCLGIPARQVLRLGQAKQLLAFRAMATELGRDRQNVEWIKKFFDFRIELAYPPDGTPPGRWSRFVRAAREALAGIAPAETVIAHEPA
jgi:hypothetical protein